MSRLLFNRDMRSTRFILILALAFTFAAQSADARPVPFSKTYETDKKLGIGLMLGVPAGFNTKFLFTDTLAVDLGIGAYIKYRDRTGFHLNADFLWHPFVAVEGESFLAPFYFGLGGRFLSAGDHNFIGIRVPFGLSFDITDSSFDIFLEGAFIVDVSISGMEPPGPVDVNGLIGVRYFIF